MLSRSTVRACRVEQTISFQKRGLRIEDDEILRRELVRGFRRGRTSIDRTVKIRYKVDTTLNIGYSQYNRRLAICDHRILRSGKKRGLRALDGYESLEYELEFLDTSCGEQKGQNLELQYKNT